MKNVAKQCLFLALLALPVAAQTSADYRRDALRALQASEVYLVSPQHSEEQGREMNRLNHAFVEKYRGYRKTTRSYLPVSVLQTDVTMAVIAKSPEAAAECHKNIEKLRALVQQGQ